MRTGITSSANNRYSYSDARQKVTIPTNTADATVRMWIYPQSSESTTLSLPPMLLGTHFGTMALTSDVQYLLILDENQIWIDTLYWDRRNDKAWVYYELDISDYAGQTIYLQFGIYNDGYNGFTSMYVDDFSLQICE